MVNRMLKITHILLLSVWPVLVFAEVQKIDDVMQMDQVKPKAQQQASASKPNTVPPKARLSQADQKKQDAFVKSLEGKDGDQIILQMQQSNAVRIAKLTPASRLFVENYQKKLHTAKQATPATTNGKNLQQALERVYLHSQSQTAGASQLSAQQLAYLEHQREKIRQRYFDQSARQKNQQVQDDAKAYLKLHMERQAEYAKQLGSNDNPDMKMKAAPVSSGRSNYTWLERQMAKQSASELTPDASLLGQKNTELVQAQIDDYLKQLRSNKSISVAQRYGAEARLISDTEARLRLQELGLTATPANIAAIRAGSLSNSAGKERKPAEAERRSTIPGL